MEKGEEGTFDVFTIDNKTADLASLGIKLGKEAFGTQWRYSRKEKMEFIWNVVIPMAITALVVTAVVRLGVEAEVGAGAEVIKTVIAIAAVVGVGVAAVGVVVASKKKFK